MTSEPKIEGENNSISIHPSVDAVCHVKGNDNTVVIEETDADSSLKLILNGSSCRVRIGTQSRCRGMDIRIGTHVPANDVTLSIGEGFTAEGNCRFLLYNRSCSLSIGSDCMLSNNIIVRCGESPHLIFDMESGEYLDKGGDVRIGRHVWIGERAYITKRARVPDNCIVAAAAVASRAYEEPNCVIAGNPGRVVRRGVQWVRNRGQLEKGSAYHRAYHEFWNK